MPASRPQFPWLQNRELEYLVLRCQGAAPKDIAALWGCGLPTVYTLGNRLMRSAGVVGGAALVDWAKGWGLDVPLGAETSAERAYPGMPKQRGRKRIRLGRMRRPSLQNQP